MPKILTQSQELRDLAKQVINQMGMSEAKRVNIGYVMVDPMISPQVAGRCIKCNNQLQLFSNCDYIIQISLNVWEKLDVVNRKILLQHELMHIDVSQNKNGELVLKLRQHDIQDFSQIINKYGVNWIQSINLLFQQIKDQNDDNRYSNI